MTQIILLVMLLISVVLFGLTNNSNYRLREEVMDMRYRLELSQANEEELRVQLGIERRAHAINYTARYTIYDTDYGASIVRLQVIIDNHTIFTNIRVYADKDSDFNHRQAEELCDKLNER